MDTEDLKNSLEQQVENYKRRLNNQVTERFSVLKGGGNFERAEKHEILPDEGLCCLFSSANHIICIN